MTPDLNQLASLMRGRNPQEVAMQMIKNNNINDPFITQLINCAQSGDTNKLNELATNFFAQRGVDFNQQFSSFLNMLK